MKLPNKGKPPYAFSHDKAFHTPYFPECDAIVFLECYAGKQAL